LGFGLAEEKLELEIILVLFEAYKFVCFAGANVEKVSMLLSWFEYLTRKARN